MRSLQPKRVGARGLGRRAVGDDPGVGFNYNAVHLATALSVDAQSLLFVTWARDLARGAVAAGCSVSPPSAVR